MRRPAFQLASTLVLLAFGLGAGFLLSRANWTTTRLSSEVESMRQALSASLLTRPSPSDRIQGVNTSARLKQPDPTTLGLLLRTLDEDPSLNVRLAAVDALFLFSGQPGVREGIVASLSKQTSPILQVALIDLLVGIRETRAAAALKSLIGSDKSAPEVRKRAELGIKELGL
jgi:HEAT repeat protein